MPEGRPCFCNCCCDTARGGERFNTYMGGFCMVVGVSAGFVAWAGGAVNNTPLLIIAGAIGGATFACGTCMTACGSSGCAENCYFVPPEVDAAPDWTVKSCFECCINLPCNCCNAWWICWTGKPGTCSYESCDWCFPCKCVLCLPFYLLWSAAMFLLDTFCTYQVPKPAALPSVAEASTARARPGWAI